MLAIQVESCKGLLLLTLMYGSLSLGLWPLDGGLYNSIDIYYYNINIIIIYNIYIYNAFARVSLFLIPLQY